MTIWLAFASGLVLGILLGVFLREFLQGRTECRDRKKLPLDRQLW
jgi:uncharacterized membrane-anchored protein YhcB (DUF1043 family)